MQCKCPHWMVYYNAAGCKEFGKYKDFLDTNLMTVRNSYIQSKISIGCGMCMPCRINYTTEWKNRLLAEGKTTENNWFLTLTYADENIPERVITDENGEVQVDYNGKPVIANPLNKKHLQDFNKRLRRRWDYEHHHEGIRHFGTGEYGDKTGRPHYHEMLFNLPLYDLKEVEERFFIKQGQKVKYTLYWSKELQKLWPYGRITVGEFNDTTCGYMAGYAVKKRKGKQAEEWYRERGLEPEFMISSRRPGIGFNYFDEHRRDMIENDRMIMSDAWGGTRVPIPKGFQQAAIRRHRPAHYDAEGNKVRPEIKPRYPEAEVEMMRYVREEHKPKKEAAAEAYFEQMLHSSSLSPEEQLRVNAEALERKMRTMKGVF